MSGGSGEDFGSALDSSACFDELGHGVHEVLICWSVWAYVGSNSSFSFRLKAVLSTFASSCDSPMSALSSSLNVALMPSLPLATEQCRS